MREIKFRGKYSWANEWIYGNLVIDKQGRNHIVPFAYFDEDGHHLSYDDDTDKPVFIKQDSIGQFTGLHDKNGKEIYEGDKFCIGGVIMFVSWHEDYSCFILTTGCEYGTINYINLDCDVIYQKEIIGNIHENPELLEGENEQQNTPKEDKTV